MIHKRGSISGLFLKSPMLGLGLVTAILLACNKEKEPEPKPNEKEAAPLATETSLNPLALPNEDWTDRRKERLQFRTHKFGSRDERDGVIVSIAVDGSDPRLVVSPGFLDSSGLATIGDTPRRSPDWRYIAVAGTDKEEESAVAILDLKTRTGKVICNRVATDPVWSMDGTSLFFNAWAGPIVYSMASGKLDTVKGDNASRSTVQLGFATRPQIFAFTKTGYLIMDYKIRVKRKSDFITKLGDRVMMGDYGELSQDGIFLANRFYHEVILVDIAHDDKVVFRDSLGESGMSLNSDGSILYYLNNSKGALVSLNWTTGEEHPIMLEKDQIFQGFSTLFQKITPDKK